MLLAGVVIGGLFRSLTIRCWRGSNDPQRIRRGAIGRCFANFNAARTDLLVYRRPS
jgi:ABC-type enterochelin transport system permease subunit